MIQIWTPCRIKSSQLSSKGLNWGGWRGVVLAGLSGIQSDDFSAALLGEEEHKDVVKGPQRIVVVKASNSGSSLVAAAAASAVSCLPRLLNIASCCLESCRHKETHEQDTTPFSSLHTLAHPYPLRFQHHLLDSGHHLTTPLCPPCGASFFPDVLATEAPVLWLGGDKCLRRWSICSALVAWPAEESTRRLSMHPRRAFSVQSQRWCYSSHQLLKCYRYHWCNIDCTCHIILC